MNLTSFPLSFCSADGLVQKAKDAAGKFATGLAAAAVIASVRLRALGSNLAEVD